jgi:hypothetical protein
MSTSKNTLSFLYIAYVFSSRKLEKTAEQVLSGNKGVWAVGGGSGDRGGVPKQCMHILINE